MSKQLRVHLIDILEAIEEIESVTRDFTFEEFKNNITAIKSVTADFAIIGETAKHISVETKRRYSVFPWKQKGGAGKKGILDFENVRLIVLWDAVRFDLPVLKSMIEHFLDDFGKEYF